MILQNYYNPFGEEDKTEIINNKTKLVLGKNARS